MASSGRRGSDGARARALRPFAADAAAITYAANQPLAGSWAGWMTDSISSNACVGGIQDGG